jgi:uncharacterized membrane protein (UPF0127 family)
MMHRKKFIWVAGFGLVLSILLLISYRSLVRAPSPSFGFKEAEINNQRFLLEVADTPETRAKGLGGRTGLNDGEGMLFIFDTLDIECFWMKDVPFAIDILWFDAKKQLIHRIDKLSPDTYPQSFCPPEPAQYVVELPAGTAARFEFGTASQLEF